MNVINRLAPLVALAGLAAGCASSEPYPTEARVAGFADGQRVVVYGSTVTAACEAIADRACEVDGCRARVLERCDADGRIETPTLETWDDLWWRCLYELDTQPGPYLGTTRPRACVRLTPFWHPMPVAPAPRYWRAVPFDTARWQPIPAACVPTLDQCASGMTCRMLGAHVGQCRTFGAGEPGDLCAVSSDCGYAMHCAQAADGADRCGVICEVNAPTRCDPGHACEPYVSDDVGLCVPS